MSKDHYWRALSIDSISTDLFPPVALYLKSGANYVLYKGSERPFTIEDRHRMERSFTEFMYVRSGDMEVINQFMEEHLAEMLARKDMSSNAKGKLLYQTSVNCLIDMFEAPEVSANLGRCRTMVQNMLQHIASDPQALRALETIIGRNFAIYFHAVQVTALSLLVHERLYALEPDELLDVGIGSLLHDYGMTFIVNDVLEKDDAISAVEYYKVKQHTQRGYEFFRDSGTYGEVVLHIVRYHHERYDGNGYPTGIRGDEIPRSAQIAALCNSYSSLVMERARKKGAPPDALAIMRKDASAGAYNQHLFEEFAAIIMETDPAAAALTHHERKAVLGA